MMQIHTKFNIIKFFVLMVYSGEGETSSTTGR